ncbi:MAG: Ig-like domain-containing protein [bacterium]|nr:Ig-like domain-containing protein [bacterium]
MLFRITAPVALLIALVGLAGCSGGEASVGEGRIACDGDDVTALCLFNCSLGCSQTGCLRSDIAQNEILILQFSDEVDPATVNPSTIRLRTASGELPVGEFFVNGRQVEFVPTLLISGGQTFFGFRPGEVYTLTIPGSRTEPNTVTSTSGFAFAETFTCSLVTSQGIQDLNGVPPSADLVSPSASNRVGVDLDTILQLDFNEMVDVTPFQNGSPVTFEVRRTTVNSNNVRVCDPNSAALPLPGTPRLTFDSARRVSVLTFQSAQPLPSNACIEINVTSAVVDLAGKPAQPQTFRFTTLTLPLEERDVTEEFDNDNQLDRDRSGGTWSGGVATFAKVGGDGRHGPFSVDLGTYKGPINGKEEYEINTDNTIIPPENTFTGTPVAVTDGRFFFDTMTVPGNVRLKFVGSSMPVITVAGRCDILGEIDIAGESLPFPSSSPFGGQEGGEGGIFAGAGGDGGDRCPGNGALPSHQGRDGESANVLAGRAYLTTAANTGGKGSTMFPANGQSSALFFAPSPTAVSYTPTASAPGGGGGLRNPGQPGEVTFNNHINPSTNQAPNPAYMGPPSVGGDALQFFPFPDPSGSDKSSIHFLFGGSGGGGAASNAALALDVVPNFTRGGGGGGGGGGIAFRAGDNLVVGPVAAIRAQGGSTAGVAASFGTANPMPGGGGSGGSIVLQSGRAADIQGEVNVAGGIGGSYARQAGGGPPIGARVEAKAGDGSDGFIRFEMPGTPTPQMLPNAMPAAQAENVAELTEEDRLSSFRSLWYSTNLVFGPEFARYEIHTLINGQPEVFSDDPAKGMLAGPGAPVRIQIQAGQMDLSTGVVSEIQPWRTGVATNQSQIGIASDGRNAFRFVIIQDRDIQPTVVIEKVVIVYQI